VRIDGGKEGRKGRREKGEKMGGGLQKEEVGWSGRGDYEMDA
jgi:hypothetical protein